MSEAGSKKAKSRPARAGRAGAAARASASTAAASASASRRKPAAAGRAAGRKSAGASPPALPSLWPSQLGAVTGQLLDLVGSAAEISFGVGKALVRRPAHRKALEQAGAMLRQAREAAGMTVGELSAAVDLKDPALLELAESGKAALPFEVLLRLAAMLARNDPVPFLLQFVRGYSPSLWKGLEQLGVARLVLHAGREHEFINIYRSRDAARRLSDEEFAQVLAFTDSAFRMALKLVGELRRGGGGGERP